MKQFQGRTLFVATVGLLAACGHVDGIRSRACLPTKKTAISFHPRNDLAMRIRGGSDEEDEDVAEEERGSQALEIAADLTKRVGILLGKTLVAAANAAKRAIEACLQVEESEEGSSITSKISKALVRMLKAVVNPEWTDDEDRSGGLNVEGRGDHDGTQKDDDARENASDFGTYLSKQYGVISTRNEADIPAAIMGGSIGDALRAARSKARLLVVFVPSSKADRSKKSPDYKAIESLMSKEVSQAAEKRSRKKAETGSYLFWAAKAGSPEAVQAFKRLKIKQQSGKSAKKPTLLVAYPAQVLGPSGSPKVVPQLLAQHHCSPPPSEESMAMWLNALRKRHAKQYAAMQLEIRESQLYKERKEGYRQSVQNDIQREEMERKAEVERLAKEAAEKERLEALELRRKEILSSLPSEPGPEIKGAKTIALRFADGRTAQRRFAPKTTVTTLFNWIDATYEIERETLVLTTMNGQKSFSWDEEDEKTLDSAGLGRMTGLRVTQKKSGPPNEDSDSPKQ